MQLYKIVRKEILAPNIFSMDILAPRVAASAKPGQFLIVIADEKGERLPLTICDYDKDEELYKLLYKPWVAPLEDYLNLKKGTT